MKMHCERYFAEKFFKILGEAEVDIYNTILDHWHRLRVKVYAAKLDLKKYREENPQRMRFPEEYEQRFLKIFNEELQRQHREMRQ